MGSFEEEFMIGLESDWSFYTEEEYNKTLETVREKLSESFDEEEIGNMSDEEVIEAYKEFIELSDDSYEENDEEEEEGMQSLAEYFAERIPD